MSTPVCRVCLTSNRKINSIENIVLRKIFEKLTESQLDAQHGANMICYICCFFLQRCHTFSEMVQKSDIILNTLFDEGFEPTQESLRFTNIDTLLPIPNLSVSEVTYLSTDHCDNTTDILNTVDIHNSIEEEISNNELHSIEGSVKSMRSIDSDNYGEKKVNIIETDVNDTEFFCTECNKTFANHSYMVHMKIHIGENVNTPMEATEQNEIKKKSTKHVLSIETSNDCHICHMSFSNEKNFQNHMLTHKFTGFPCKVCKKRYASPRYLMVHMRTHTGESDMSYDLCNNSFGNDYTLQKHKSENHDKGIFFCSKCSGNFNSKTDLIIHIESHVEDSKFRQYICEKCHKVFTLKSKLKTHMTTHVDGKSFICNECDKAYKTKETLSRHIKTHAPKTTSHTCDRCGKIFANNSCLRTHILQIHMGERPFACDQCGKTFKRNYQLLEHTRVHTGEKPYSCDICSQKFTQSSSLGNHRRIHSGQRPYICDLCNKKFIDKYSLQSHMITHTGEKAYACDKCTQMFTKNSSLHKHILRFHSGYLQETISCDKCLKTFNQISNLRRHIKKIHVEKS